jgi:hypothetical protein
MSARNKLENKYTRSCTRNVAKTPSGTERVGRVPQEISANILANPKQMRLSGKSRRRLQRGRGLAVVLDTKAPGIPAVKVALALQRLSYVKLLRRMQQAARRAATCKYLLLSLSSISKFAEGVAAEQTFQLSLLRQVAAEIKSRNHQTN